MWKSILHESSTASRPAYYQYQCRRKQREAIKHVRDLKTGESQTAIGYSLESAVGQSEIAAEIGKGLGYSCVCVDRKSVV